MILKLTIKLSFIIFIMVSPIHSIAASKQCPKEFNPPDFLSEDKMLKLYMQYNESISSTPHINTKPDIDKSITSYSQLLEKIKINSNLNKPTLVFVSGDWSVESRVLSNGPLKDQKIIKALKGVIKVDVDVTANDDIAIYKAFKFLDPPALIYYSASGDLKGGIYSKCVEVADILSWLSEVK